MLLRKSFNCTLVRTRRGLARAFTSAEINEHGHGCGRAELLCGEQALAELQGGRTRLFVWRRANVKC